MSNEFKNLEISDRSWVIDILNNSPCPSLEYNFTTLFIWQKIFNTQVLSHNGFLLSISGKEHKSFLFPTGSGDLKKETDFLIDYAKNEGFSVKFHSLSADAKEFLENTYPGRFIFTEDRDSGDYIYSADKLKTLTGKKLAAKRNHINRFIENYPEWKYEKISDKNISDVLAMHSKWCENSNCQSEPGLKDESCAVRRALKYYNELCLSGGVLKIQDKICAFSIGDKLNSDTFLVHIEKAFAEIQGAYPMINKQFVIHNCDGFEFVNREDDTGDEGLRKAKLSYQPLEIIKKFNAKEI